MLPAARCPLILLLAALLTFAGAAQAQTSGRTLMWTQAPLADALYEFSEASGVEIVFALRLVRDVRVSGEYAPEDPPGPALAALLDGTGLRAERIRRGQFVLISIPVNIPIAGNDPSFYTGVMEGRVVDAETGESLFGAHVWLVDLALGDVVDARGEFAVENLPTGKYAVRVSHIGYKPVRVELDVFPASPQLPPTIRLRPESVQSAAATVRPQALPPEPEPGLSLLALPDGTSRGPLAIAGPVLGDDLLGGLSLVPGVSRTDGASGPLTIRGADPGRALVVRDGVPVYASGARGLSFQPEALQAARLHSGPLPVELDGGAGVLEMETRPAGDEPHGTIAAGLGGLRGVASAPLAANVGAIVGWGRPSPAELPLASAREAGRALVVDPRGRRGLVEAESRTWDAEAKVTWTPRPAQTVEVGAYRSAETLGATLGERTWRLHGASDAASVRYQGLLGDATFATAIVYGSRARGDEQMGGLNTQTSLDEAGARIEVDHALSLAHQIRVGVHAAAQRADADRGSASLRQRLGQIALYARDTWKPSDRVELRPGVRVAVIGSQIIAEPRLQARWSVVPAQLDIRAGLSRQSQAVHRLQGLASGGRDLAATRWLLSSGPVAPEVTWLSGIGAEWRPAAGVTLGVDVFARAARDVRLATGPAMTEPPAMTEALRAAWAPHRERATGLDLAGAFQSGDWAVQGGLSFTLAEVRPENSRLWRPSRYSRPVSFALAAERTVGAGTVGLRLDAESGRPDGLGGRQKPDLRLTLGADAQASALGVIWTLGVRGEGRLLGTGSPMDAPLAPGAPLALGPLGSGIVPGLRLAARW